MNTSLNVKEALFDNHSFFNIKRFNIGSLSVDRPIRTIDATKIPPNFAPNMEVQLYEISRLMRRETILNIVRSNYQDIFGAVIKIPRHLKGKEYFISITFDFNPLKELSETESKSKDILNDFLQYYHTYSPSILLVPNVKITRTIQKEGSKKGKQIDIMDSDQYLRYVEEAVNILSYRNRKPIFVPLSLRFSIGSIGKIAYFYASKGYTNVWIDFEGNSISEGRIARIRKFLQVMESAELLNDLVIIATNVRREITTNINRDYTPASDILVSVTGANIIGVNKEPRRYIEGKIQLPKEKLREHKARVFDSQSYYYIKVTKAKWLPHIEKQKILQSLKYGVMKNIILTDTELRKQSQEFMANLNLKEYLSQKNMLKEYKSGKLLSSLFSMRAKNKRISWF